MGGACGRSANYDDNIESKYFNLKVPKEHSKFNKQSLEFIANETNFKSSNLIANICLNSKGLSQKMDILSKIIRRTNSNEKIVIALTLIMKLNESLQKVQDKYHDDFVMQYRLKKNIMNGDDLEQIRLQIINDEYHTSEQIIFYQQKFYELMIFMSANSDLIIQEYVQKVIAHNIQETENINLQKLLSYQKRLKSVLFDKKSIKINLNKMEMDVENIRIKNLVNLGRQMSHNIIELNLDQYCQLLFSYKEVQYQFIQSKNQDNKLYTPDIVDNNIICLLKFVFDICQIIKDTFCISSNFIVFFDQQKFSSTVYKQILDQMLEQANNKKMKELFMKSMISQILSYLNNSNDQNQQQKFMHNNQGSTKVICFRLLNKMFQQTRDYEYPRLYVSQLGCIFVKNVDSSKINQQFYDKLYKNVIKSGVQFVQSIQKQDGIGVILIGIDSMIKQIYQNISDDYPRVILKDQFKLINILLRQIDRVDSNQTIPISIFMLLTQMLQFKKYAVDSFSIFSKIVNLKETMMQNKQMLNKYLILDLKSNTTIVEEIYKMVQYKIQRESDANDISVSMISQSYLQNDDSQISEQYQSQKLSSSITQIQVIGQFINRQYYIQILNAILFRQNVQQDMITISLTFRIVTFIMNQKIKSSQYNNALLLMTIHVLFNFTLINCTKNMQNYLQKMMSRSSYSVIQKMENQTVEQINSMTFNNVEVADFINCNKHIKFYEKSDFNFFYKEILKHYQNVEGNDKLQFLELEDCLQIFKKESQYQDYLIQTEMNDEISVSEQTLTVYPSINNAAFQRKLQQTDDSFEFQIQINKHKVIYQLLYTFVSMLPINNDY